MDHKGYDDAKEYRGVRSENDSNHRYDNHSSEGKHSESHSHGAKGGLGGLDAGFLRNLKALVVDDVPLNRKMLASLLNTHDVSFDMAEDGLIAFNAVERKGSAYDIILLDNSMPNMTGIECAKALRRIGFNNAIIGVTGISDDDEFSNFENSGADIVLTKPLKQDMVDQLLAYFQERGTRSPKSLGIQLHVVGGKLSWAAQRDAK